MANNPYLTDVTLSNGVSEIKTQAFDGCANLATITLTDSITKIGDKAFRGINSNAVFEIKANKKNYQRIIKLIKDSGIADGITFKRIK